MKPHSLKLLTLVSKLAQSYRKAILLFLLVDEAARILLSHFEMRVAISLNNADPCNKRSRIFLTLEQEILATHKFHF